MGKRDKTAAELFPIASDLPNSEELLSMLFGTCDVSFCTAGPDVIHNGVKLCRGHHDDPEWAV